MAAIFFKDRLLIQSKYLKKIFNKMNKENVVYRYSKIREKYTVWQDGGYGARYTCGIPLGKL